MLVSEVEAREKWCPHVRRALPAYVGAAAGSGGAVAAGNRGGSGDPLPIDRCLGSSCMAWGWWSQAAAAPRLGYCRLMRLAPPP